MRGDGGPVATLEHVALAAGLPSHRVAGADRSGPASPEARRRVLVAAERLG